MESRSLPAALPWGATPNDTAELLLGDVHVNVVFLESSGQIDPSTEDWTAQQISEVKQRVVEGISWWKEALDELGTVHDLNFHFDFTFADNPFETAYEPIARVSQDFTLWVNEFLDEVGFGDLGSGDVGISKGIRAFNHTQRVESESHWGFTIFVVDADNDADGRFAAGSDFSRAFAFAGGRFLVSPSNRPASTYAHEMGHIFYALDEHAGGSSYNARRGYYNTQNLNGERDRPASAGPQVVSIMDDHITAFPGHAISPTAKEMVGWRDSDADGIFDVLDMDLSLTGSGGIDPQTGLYRFVGQASVGVLRNLNQSSFQSDVTINQVSRIQYRIDGGPWTDALEPHAYQVDLDFSFAVPAGEHVVEIRALDDATNEPGEAGVKSEIFRGSTTEPTATVQPGINGFLWNDLDGDGERDAAEPALTNWTVQVRGASGQQLDLTQNVEPDDYTQDEEINDLHPGVKLTAAGASVGSSIVSVRAHADAATGSAVFSHQLPTLGPTPTWSTAWTGLQRQLSMEFTEPVSTVSIDVIGVADGSYGRLEILNSAFQVIDRVTTGPLAAGEVATLTLRRPTVEIARAVATGHADTEVRLDNLRFGPETAAVTDLHGAWSVPSLDAGDFRVEVTPPAGWQITSQGGAARAVSLASGAVIEDVRFGFRFVGSPWHNAPDPEDVNRDQQVNHGDMLAVVSYLRDHNAGPLSGQPGPNDPRVDVNGDGAATLTDLLAVVTRLRDQFASPD